jgi:hypothetical protein
MHHNRRDGDAWSTSTPVGMWEMRAWAADKSSRDFLIRKFGKS